MGWIGREINLGRIIILATIFLIGLDNASFAGERQKAKQWEIDLANLIKEKRYDEALSFVNKSDLPENPVIFQARGHLLGSGLLSSGKDLCGAIYNLEKAYESWKFLLVDLNFLYGGDWAGIAALEGNAEALFYVGERILFSKSNGSAFLIYDETLAAKESYIYFYNAAELGHEEAKNYLTRISNKNPNIDFSRYAKKIRFKEIYCPVREYTDAG